MTELFTEKFQNGKACIPHIAARWHTVTCRSTHVNPYEMDLLISSGIISEKGQNSFMLGRMSCRCMKMQQACLVFALITHLLLLVSVILWLLHFYVIHLFWVAVVGGWNCDVCVCVCVWVCCVCVCVVCVCVCVYSVSLCLRLWVPISTDTTRSRGTELQWAIHCLGWISKPDSVLKHFFISPIFPYIHISNLPCRWSFV